MTRPKNWAEQMFDDEPSSVQTMTDFLKFLQEDEPMTEAFSIEEFCRAHRFSRAHYFNLKRDGLGPREMKVGGRVLISKEAASDWRRECEARQKRL